MFILKEGHQPGVYVPLRALFLVIIIIIKRPKKLKNGLLTKRNCHKAAVTRPQFDFEIANGGQNEKKIVLCDL